MRNLGHFELLEKIGKGGMATVFRAHDRSLNRKVAIKLLDDNLAQEYPQFVEGFIREAQHAAAMSHPNIVNIYFVGVEAGCFYIAMELLEGNSLAELIENNEPQNEEAVIEIGIRMADALRAAYTNQLIHGDIKPQNIFITRNGVPKLLDFGLAKTANMAVTVESDGGVWGSAYYISPERIRHEVEDFRSDIYSLGATLFHALAGQPPFDGATPAEVAQKHLNEQAPALRKISPGISEITEKIIAAMLYPTPLLRYPDYDSLISDLVAAKQQLLYPSAHKTMAPAQARVPAKTKRSFFMMSSAVLLLVGIGIALLVFYNGNLVNRLGKLAKGHAWMQRASPTPPPIEAPLPVGAFTVSSTYPAHDAKILDYTCRQIIVRFNHPVNKSTLKNVKLVGEGVTGLGLPEFDDSVSASFKIVGSLQPGHQYKITVPTKVLDADGKPLARKCQFSFSTE